MNNKKQTQQTEVMVTTPQLAQDVKHSVLIVSLLLNLIVLTTWITLQVTSKYDTSAANFFFG